MPTLKDILIMPGDPMVRPDPTGPSWVEECEERFQVAIANAYTRGYAVGFDLGKSAGAREGQSLGYDKGYDRGCSEGYALGKAEGHQEAVQTLADRDLLRGGE
jgi:flagellar biosynthesis/type III secretory pathway protein FliH